ncbi:MAG: Hsp70 family protein [Thermoanaerobaculia bacterium]
MSPRKGWALDLGTTNSSVAFWDDTAGQPRLIELRDVCRHAEASDPMAAGRLVPSSVDFDDQPGLLDRVGCWPLVERHAFLGRTARIGRQALERNAAGPRPGFVPTFKPGLSTDPLRPVARQGGEPVTARQAAHRFLRELLREVRATTGERIRDLVVTSPVAVFETYRAEVQRILTRLGVHRVRFLDEPVAAAIGYGLSLAHERTALVVDVGGGTMHVVLARLSPHVASTGKATVLAKSSRPIGGNAVDGWVLEEVCQQVGYDLRRDADDEVTRLWRRFMLAEACRVKEALFFAEQEAFLVEPPGPPRARREPARLARNELIEILDRNGFYAGLLASVDEVLSQAKMRPDEVEDVLVVGGSSLLPGFFARLEQRFDRGQMRAWQPFEAVASGAATFAGERMETFDFIVHDYALQLHDASSGKPEYVVVVPKGTRFPTARDLWKRDVVPTCALGEPESVFKLLVFEVSRASGERRFVWDATGRLHRIGGNAGEAGVEPGGESEIVVSLNAANPTLGVLDPPHRPEERRPRLEVSFGVNAERWLIATVRDLLTQRELLSGEPIVRLV